MHFVVVQDYAYETLIFQSKKEIILIHLENSFDNSAKLNLRWKNTSNENKRFFRINKTKFHFKISVLVVWTQKFSFHISISIFLYELSLNFLKYSESLIYSTVLQVLVVDATIIESEL